MGGVLDVFECLCILWRDERRRFETPHEVGAAVHIVQVKSLRWSLSRSVGHVSDFRMCEMVNVIVVEPDSWSGIYD